MPLAYDDGHYEYGELVEKIMKEKGFSKEKAGAYVHGIEERQKKALLVALKLSKLKLAFDESEHKRETNGQFQGFCNTCGTGSRLTTKEHAQGWIDSHKKERGHSHTEIYEDKPKTAKDTLLTQLKLSRIKLKLADTDTYNDDNSPDNYQYDKGTVYKKKIAKGENLPDERDFKNQLSKGTLVELESTRDQDIARSIAEDNLKSDPEYYRKLERIHKYSTLGYAKTSGSLEEIIEWWDGLNVSKRQHAIDPNRLFPESIMTSRKTHEGLVLKEKMEVIIGYFFRHQDTDSTNLLGYNIKGSAQEWWDTWNVSQRQHMIDPHQFLESYVMCTKLYDDLSIPERENVDKMYQSKVNEYSGASRSAMKLASQSGKYAKYWILNAKDVNGNGWGVSPGTIKQNIASFVGKPFVITANTWIPESEYEGVYDHPYIPSDNMDTVLGYQEKFRVGNIDKIIEDEKGDYYAMIAIDENYRHLPLPPFCSPAIYQMDQREPEGDISKWVGLHLAGLMENPAYGPRVAILSGTCVGTPGQCHTQFNH